MTLGIWQLVDYYLSPIKHLFRMDGVTEIEVNRFDKVFIERDGKTIFMPDVRFSNEDQMTLLIHQIANALKQPVDQDYPILDARLEDGTRVCGILAPVATQGSSMTFRVFPSSWARCPCYGSLLDTP